MDIKGFLLILFFLVPPFILLPFFIWLLVRQVKKRKASVTPVNASPGWIDAAIVIDMFVVAIVAVIFCAVFVAWAMRPPVLQFRYICAPIVLFALLSGVVFGQRVIRRAQKKGLIPPPDTPEGKEYARKFALAIGIVGVALFVAILLL